MDLNKGKVWFDVIVKLTGKGARSMALRLRPPRRVVLMEHHSIWGEKIRPYVMPAERSVGVDSELDLKLVEGRVQQGQPTNPLDG